MAFLLTLLLHFYDKTSASRSHELDNEERGTFSQTIIIAIAVAFIIVAKNCKAEINQCS